MRSAWALGVCLSVVACGNVDDRPFVWGYLSPAIFQPTCATPSCHSRAVAVAGLDFSDPDRGYTSLTAGTVWIVDPNGSAANGCEPYDGTFVCPRDRQLVVPNDPGQSRLVSTLRARGAPRMPPDRPLPEKDIELIESWILNGASRSSATGPTPPRDAGAGDARDAGGTPGNAAAGDGGLGDSRNGPGDGGTGQ